jgi:cytochrome P450
VTPETGVADDQARYVFDPFAPGFASDPYPHYARLRELDPVHQHPLGFWILGRHDHVSHLLRGDLSVEDRNEAPSPLRELREAGSGDGFQSCLATSMLFRDPPDHTRLRKLVSMAFNRRAVEALEQRVTELVDAALDRMADAQEVDLVAELAYPLPFTVICELLGMPDTDHAHLRDLIGVLARSVEPVTDPALLGTIAAADTELAERVGEVIAAKRRAPGDDLLTALIQAEDDGDVLSEEELVSQVLLLYVAGHETTVNLIANGMIALLRNPDQYRLLVERPDLDGNAVEELLRYDSPVQQSRRITLSPYQVGDKEIPAGAFVLAGLASANHDETFFGEDADRLRLDRPNAKSHLSFGGRPHNCVGAALARMQAKVAIGRLVRRFPDLRLAGPVNWKVRLNLRGPEEVPVATG